MLRHAAAVLFLCSWASAQQVADCMSEATCTAALDTTTADVRQRLVDRIQSEIQSMLEIAPTALATTDVMYSEGALTLALTTQQQRDAVAQRLYYQMKNLPEVYWLYMGEESTGRFLGFRRTTQAEINSGKSADMLVRTECAGTGQPMLYYNTDVTDANGGDAQGVAFASETYNLLTRGWYTLGKSIPLQTDLFTDANYRWSDPYTFNDGSLGLSAVRRIEAPQPPTTSSTTTGVLAADYTLKFLQDFINTLEMPDLPDGSKSPFIVFDGPSRHLIGTNLGAPLQVSGNVVTVTSSTNTIVRDSTTQLYSSHPEYGQTTANWVTLKTNTKAISVTVSNMNLRGNSVGLEFPEGGTSPLRWVILAITEKDMGYTLLPTDQCATGETTKLGCRDTLMGAAADLRVRTLQHLTWTTTQYLGTAFVVVNNLDQSYNLGDFEASYCNLGSCGMIDLRVQAERTNVQQHLKNLLFIYSQIYWVYVGQEAGRQYLGFLRPDNDNNLQRWECNNGINGDCGTAKFIKESDGSTVSTDSTDPLTRPWYARAWAELQYDEQRWTQPYVFGNGVLGISITKKSFGGDFSTTGGYGVWACDFSFEFFSTYIASLNMISGTVLYIVARDGTLVASNRGVTAGGAAASSTDAVIKGTQDEVVKAADQWHSSRPLSQMWIHDDGTVYFVDSLRLTDTTASVKNTYDWAFVACVPESEIYSIDFSGAPSLSTGMLQMVLVAVVALFAAVH